MKKPFLDKLVASVYKEYPIGHGISPQILMILSLVGSIKKGSIGTFFIILHEAAIG
jgi:hypothetical protein